MDLFKKLNIFKQCREYNLSLWQCPQFLFVIMGLVIIASALLTYLIGTRYIKDPLTVALIVLILAVILFVLAYIIVRSFERLAESVRMKSKFVGIASHQLRSPLSNLQWVTEMIESERIGQLGEQQLEYFRMVKENVARMQKLISDLVTVYKIQDKRVDLRPKQVSLEQLARKVISEFEFISGAHPVDIDIEAEPDLPSAWADPEKIKTVIKNLLDNAIRYTDSEPRKINISISQQGNQLKFEIEDEGIGIPQQDQDYIFKKFFRGKNATRHQVHGTGLSLFIIKSIIEKSGGKIWFKSKQGRGTTFWFTLPIK